MIGRGPISVLILLLAGLPVATLHGQTGASRPLVLDGTVQRYRADLHLDLLEDPAHTLKEEDVQRPAVQARFRSNTTVAPNFGYSRSTFILRLPLVNQTSRTEWLLEVDNPSMSEVTLLVPGTSGPDRVVRTGTRVPYNDRAYPARTFVFPITLPSDTARTVYLGLHSDEPVWFSIHLWEPIAFQRHARDTQLLLGLYYGILFIMVLYHLVLYRSLSDRTYLYFVFFILGQGLLGLVSDGLAYMYLWPEAPIWNQEIRAILNGSNAFWSLLFTRSFLLTARHTPRIDWGLQGFALLGVLLILLKGGWLATQLGDVSITTAFALLGAIVAMGTLVLGAIVRRRFDIEQMRFRILAGIGLAFGSILFVLALMPTPGNQVGDFDRAINTILSLGGIGLIAVAGVQTLRQGYRPARYFLIGMAGFMLGGMIDVLRHIGLLPQTAITVLSDKIGAVIGLVLLSFGLGDRINTLKRNIEQAERRAVENQRKAAELRFEALQAKINPHFLFNTLNAIASLILDDPKRAERAVVRLSRLFRYTLNASERGTVSLREELDILRSYLELEQLRLDERLAFEIHVEGNPDRVDLPGLVLQPLAENSIKYGIGPRKEGGRIEVAAYIGSEVCRLVVRDNGVGLSDSGSGSGHGLKSVRERLALRYDDRFEMHIREDRGVVVELEIPIQPVADTEPV